MKMYKRRTVAEWVKVEWLFLNLTSVWKGKHSTRYFCVVIYWQLVITYIDASFFHFYLSIQYSSQIIVKYLIQQSIFWHFHNVHFVTSTSSIPSVSRREKYAARREHCLTTWVNPRTTWSSMWQKQQNILMRFLQHVFSCDSHCSPVEVTHSFEKCLLNGSGLKQDCLFYISRWIFYWLFHQFVG